VDETIAPRPGRAADDVVFEGERPVKVVRAALDDDETLIDGEFGDQAIIRRSAQFDQLRDELRWCLKLSPWMRR